MTDNTERYMIDNCGTLIDKKTCTCYDYLEEILPTLNQQENRIKELQAELQNLQTLKKLLESLQKLNIRLTDIELTDEKQEE